MKKMTTRALAASAALLLAGSLLATEGPPPPRRERVAFAQGASSATIKGSLKGYADVDYLMRAAARRNESSKYALSVAVTGKPLPPLSAARDAKVAGTAYHTTAKVPCTLPYQPDVKSCDAGVIRRGNDGTATFEAIGSSGVQRRILFVQGKPLAADTMDPVTATRQGDVTVVEVSDNERYDIPDAFLNGG